MVTSVLVLGVPRKACPTQPRSTRARSRQRGGWDNRKTKDLHTDHFLLRLPCHVRQWPY